MHIQRDTCYLVAVIGVFVGLCQVSTDVNARYYEDRASDGVDAKCGTADGVATSSRPADNLCADGTASHVLKSRRHKIWSTAAYNGGAGGSGRVIPPSSSFYAAGQTPYFSWSFNNPAGACGSPDSDGLFSSIQPNHWAVETYATVVFANGDVDSGDIASYYDLTGDGTACWNGPRASMIPNIAGAIRKDEIASGLIQHALAIYAPTSAMARQVQWPALTFDTGSSTSYSGTLAMGSLLAIPASVDINSLGLSPQALVVAKAAQDYGVYVVDTDPGVTFVVELGASDADGVDVSAVSNALQLVTNNSQSNVGGGGTPRAPLAPPFADGSPDNNVCP